MYGTSIQIWTQTKRKNAPKDQINSEFKLTLKSKQKTNESRKVLQRFVDNFGITYKTKLRDPENKMTQTHHMNRTEIQARLKYPKIKIATQFTIESYTKLKIRCSWTNWTISTDWNA